MTTVRLGKTGITTCKNGFGALPIQRISFEEADALIMQAYERLGIINEIDQFI